MLPTLTPSSRTVPLSHYGDEFRISDATLAKQRTDRTFTGTARSRYVSHRVCRAKAGGGNGSTELPKPWREAVQCADGRIMGCMPYSTSQRTCISPGKFTVSR